MATGKFTAEKIQDLAVHWAKVLDKKHPTLDFATKLNLEPPKEREDPAETQEMGLEGLRDLNRTLSEGPDPDTCPFKRGDEVTVVRRMSWVLPQKDDPKFRKDLPVDTQGVVEGFADPEHRQVLLKVTLNVKGKNQQHMQAVLDVMSLQTAKQSLRIVPSVA